MRPQLFQARLQSRGDSRRGEDEGGKGDRGGEHQVRPGRSGLVERGALIGPLPGAHRSA